MTSIYFLQFVKNVTRIAICKAPGAQMTRHIFR